MATNKMEEDANVSSSMEGIEMERDSNFTSLSDEEAEPKRVAQLRRLRKETRKISYPKGLPSSLINEEEKLDSASMTDCKEHDDCPEKRRIIMKFRRTTHNNDTWSVVSSKLTDDLRMDGSESAKHRDQRSTVPNITVPAVCRTSDLPYQESTVPKVPYRSRGLPYRTLEKGPSSDEEVVPVDVPKEKVVFKVASTLTSSTLTDDLRMGGSKSAKHRDQRSTVPYITEPDIYRTKGIVPAVYHTSGLPYQGSTVHEVPYRTRGLPYRTLEKGPSSDEEEVPVDFPKEKVVFKVARLIHDEEELGNIEKMIKKYEPTKIYEGEGLYGNFCVLTLILYELMPSTLKKIESYVDICLKRKPHLCEIDDKLKAFILTNRLVRINLLVPDSLQSTSRQKEDRRVKRKRPHVNESESKRRCM